MVMPYVLKTSDQALIVDRHGDWTAMSIKLPGGRFTREPAEDPRLFRIMQVCSDLLGRPISGCRVADLACLEFQYGIEFALRGADVVGLELREANIEKAAFAAQALGLSNTTLYRDDVMNFTRENYGEFDVIICSGILYHLPGCDPIKLIGQMAEACRGMVILDTFVSMNPRINVSFKDREFRASVYREHDPSASEEEKLRDKWASVSNTESLWYSEPSLAEAAQLAGFTTMARVLLPSHPGVLDDRRTYVILKGTRTRILTSDPTDSMGHTRPREYDATRIHPSQRPKSILRRAARAITPSCVVRALRRRMLSR